MDGIDGIAGVETITSALVIGILLLLYSDVKSVPMMHFLIIACVFGFLFWNFPPAKMFLGDVGSGFLGLMIAALLLMSSHINANMFWAWLIVLGVFIVDATFTLGNRLLRGDKVYQAHRSHAYQNASRQYNSHLVVTVSVLAINMLWLSPWAYLVVKNVIDGVLALTIAYIPLLGLALYFNAGKAMVVWENGANELVD